MASQMLWLFLCCLSLLDAFALNWKTDSLLDISGATIQDSGVMGASSGYGNAVCSMSNGDFRIFHPENRTFELGEKVRAPTIKWIPYFSTGMSHVARSYDSLIIDRFEQNTWTEIAKTAVGFPPNISFVGAIQPFVYVFNLSALTLINVSDPLATITQQHTCSGAYAFFASKQAYLLCANSSGVYLQRVDVDEARRAIRFLDVAKMVQPSNLDNLICHWQVDTDLFIVLFNDGLGILLNTTDGTSQSFTATAPSDHGACFSIDDVHFFVTLGRLNNFQYSSTSPSAGPNSSQDPDSSTTSTSTSTATSTSTPSSSSESPRTSSSQETQPMVSTWSSIPSSTSDDAAAENCEIYLRTADCTEPTAPVVNVPFPIGEGDELYIPMTVSTLTWNGNMTVTGGKISFQLAASAVKDAKIDVLGTLYADHSILDLMLSDAIASTEFQVLLFRFEFLIGDFELRVSTMTSKRSQTCSASRIPRNREYLVKIDCLSEESVDSSKNNKSGLIAGIVVGIVFILSVFLVVAVIIWRRKKHQSLQEKTNIEMSKTRALQLKDTFLENVFVETKVGSGNFGDVYRGRWSGNLVAMKRMKDSEDSDFTSEIETLSLVVHPNIVQYFGLGVEDDRMYLVMEWMPLGSLVDMVQKIDDVSLLVDIAKQCAAGMVHLEEKKIIHRDIALRNVLMAESDGGRYIAKIADFGMSRDTSAGDYTSDGNVFPIKWCAPEIIEHRQFNIHTDVWAFGIMLWEMFSRGKKPYPKMTNKEAVDFVLSGGRMDPPETCPAPIASLMLQMWNSDPRQRPNFHHIHKTIKIC